MITAKFGGTAVTPENLFHIKEILTPFHRAVVVSAVGKEFSADEKTTDLLGKYFTTRSEEIWQKIENKYKRLAERNGVAADVEKMLYDAKMRAVSYDLQYCLSLGEELSARVVSAYLGANYVEAESCVVFGKDGLDVEKTYRCLKSAFEGVDRGVIGGFYGGTVHGRKTFPRGGSDITGSLVAAATDSSVYENWTDVYGVCAADPSRANNVKTLSVMSYSEMLELSLGGAEVLHPDAVAPCRDRAIPIYIGNFFNKCGQGTLVCNCPSRNRLLSIAEKRENGRYVTTVLHNYGIYELNEKMNLFLRDNTETRVINGVEIRVEKIPVYSLRCSGKVAKMESGASVVKKLYECFLD